MVLPQMKTLVNTAFGVAVVGVGATIYLQLRRLDEINNSQFFKDAFNMLKTHNGAISHLGEPIKRKGFRVSKEENILASEKAQFLVNVEGSIDNGKMHLWAKPSDGEWSISRIELELDKFPDRRLLIKDGPKIQQQPTQQQQQ